MNHKEFTEQIIPIGDKAYRLARNILRDGVEAEDVVQDVMEQMWSRRGVLDRIGNPEAYVMRSVRNAALDRQKLIRLRAGHLQNVAHTSDRFTTSESGFDLQELVAEYVATLSEQQRTVLHLRDVEGYEFDTIGEILQMESGAVRVALSRARKEIRERLQRAIEYGTK